MPLISIILPIYNAEKYLIRALSSCLNQTLKDIEIIIVDDKGYDESINIVTSYAKYDERIVIIDNIQNQGPYNSRINGIKFAKSDYLMFLDSDDELELNACEVVFEHIKPSVDLIFFNANICSNHVKNKIWNYGSSIHDIDCNEHVDFMIKFGWPMWNKLYYKPNLIKTIDKVPNFKGKMAEDFLFNCVYSQFCNNALVINSCLYNYYININSTTTTRHLQDIILNLDSYDNVYNIIKNSEIDVKFKTKALKIIRKEKYIYGANNINYNRNSKLLSIFLWIKYKILKKFVK